MRLRLGIRICGFWLWVGFAIAIGIINESSKRGNLYEFCVLFPNVCVLFAIMCVLFAIAFVLFLIEFVIVRLCFCGVIMWLLVVVRWYCVIIVCHSPFPWCVPLCFPNFVIVFVNWLGLCACIVGCRFCFFQSCSPYVFFYAILNVLVDPG